MGKEERKEELVSQVCYSMLMQAWCQQGSQSYHLLWFPYKLLKYRHWSLSPFCRWGPGSCSDLLTWLVIRLGSWAFAVASKTVLHHQGFHKKAKTTHRPTRKVDVEQHMKRNSHGFWHQHTADLLCSTHCIIMKKVPKFSKFVFFFFHLEMKIPVSILSAFHGD